MSRPSPSRALPREDAVKRLGRRLLRRSVTAGPALTLLVSATLAALVGYLIHENFLASWAAETTAARARLETLRRENDANQEIQRTRPQFVAAFRRALEKYDSARQLLPAEVEVSNVLAAVQEMAARNGVRVTRFNATSPGVKSPAADRLYERAVPATVVGPHAAVARFLADVARYPRIIHVRDLAITSLKKTESVDFTLVTFYSPPGLPPIPHELLAERGEETPNARQTQEEIQNP